MAGIFRKQTEQEKADFENIFEESFEKKFTKELAMHEHKANKKGLPFAAKAAKDEFNESIADQAKTQMKMHGKVNRSKIKIPTIDWDRYSDLKNFEVVETKKVRDKYLSKEHKTPIYLNSTVYRFKGYGIKYRMMEDGDLAIERAYEKEAQQKVKKGK